MRRHSSSGLKPHGSPLVDLSRDAECDVSSGHCSSTYAGGGGVFDVYDVDVHAGHSGYSGLLFPGAVD